MINDSKFKSKEDRELFCKMQELGTLHKFEDDGKLSIQPIFIEDGFAERLSLGLQSEYPIAASLLEAINQNLSPEEWINSLPEDIHDESYGICFNDDEEPEDVQKAGQDLALCALFYNLKTNNNKPIPDTEVDKIGSSLQQIIIWASFSRMGLNTLHYKSDQWEDLFKMQTQRDKRLKSDGKSLTSDDTGYFLNLVSNLKKYGDINKNDTCD